MATTALEVASADHGPTQQDDPTGAAKTAQVHEETVGAPRAGWARRHRGILVIAALGVLIVVLVALGVLQFLRARDAADANQLRAEAVQTADQTVVNLTSMNAASAPQDMQRLLGNTTGSFHDKFTQQAKMFEQVLQGSKVTSVGKVTEAGVVSSDDKNAVVLNAVTATVKNTQAPAGQQRVYRMKVSLQRAQNHWLVSNLEFVA